MQCLAPLTPLENNLLSLNRCYRNVYVLKPDSWSWAGNGTCQLAQRAHVLAIPNVGPDRVRDQLLPSLDSLPDLIQVVLLTLVDYKNPVAREEAIERMCARAPALSIRGPLVCKWAIHLAQVRYSNRHKCITDDLTWTMQVNNLPPPDEALLAQYRDLTHVPPSVLRQTKAPCNRAECEALVRRYLGADRSGPANNHQHDPRAILEQALAGPDASPPPIPAGLTPTTCATGALNICIHGMYLNTASHHRCSRH